MADIIDIGLPRYRNVIRERVTFMPKVAAQLAEDLRVKVERKVREEWRATLAREEADARQSIRELRRQHKQIEANVKRKQADLDKLAQRIASERLKLMGEQEQLPWPQVPGQRLPILDRGENMPAAPGVYFLWNDQNIVEYVGQSVNLSGRVRRSHEKVCLITKPAASFVQVEAYDLTYAECFYIGFLKPRLNGCTPARREKINNSSLTASLD